VPVRSPKFVIASVACALGVGSVGCASRADLEQLRQSNLQVRRVVADQSVAIEDLRRRLEMVRAASDEGGPQRSSDETAWRASVEARIAAIERRPAAVIPDVHMGTPPSPDHAGTTGLGSAPPAQAEIVPLNAPPAPAAAASSDLASALAREDELLRGAQVDPDYRAAIESIRAGRCVDAIPQLQGLVRKNIRSPFADKAQYWIGRCFQIQGDHNRAVRELYDVILKFPQSDRVPAALLVLADAFAAAGDDIDARLALRKVVSEHPTAAEAEVARQRLRALGE